MAVGALVAAQANLMPPTCRATTSATIYFGSRQVHLPAVATEAEYDDVEHLGQGKSSRSTIAVALSELDVTVMTVVSRVRASSPQGDPDPGTPAPKWPGPRDPSAKLARTPDPRPRPGPRTTRRFWALGR